MIVVQEAPGSNAKSLLSNGSDFHRAGRGINLVATANFLNGRGRPGCFKHQVGTPTFGQFIDHLSQVFFRNVNGPDRAQLGRPN